MHFHLPKPLHGWREFAGEVGIIVLGVLIALSAEQVVESWHSQREIHETSEALNSELGRDLGAFNWRWNQRPCLRPRVVEIDRWARSMGGPQPLKLRKEVTEPSFFAIHTAVWKATSGEVSARMPVETKLGYADMYDAVGVFDEIQRDEAKAWTVIESYGENTQLTREELHDVRNAILDLRSDDAILDSFRHRLDSAAAKLGIRAKEHIEAGLETQLGPSSRKICESLLA
jgi:hypothetical protein